MGVLTQLEPKAVFRYFEEITKIPHGSGNLTQISNYLVDFAKRFNLEYRQDESKNVIIFKEASKGYEDAAPVIIQGHMDMVAVKESLCEKDMQEEGLDLEINDDKISAKGTSLGGDDGVAIAYALAVLEADNLLHPAIEAVFTADEEIGMLGATALDMSHLKGRTMLNIDSDDEGVFTVSCAGGATVECILPYTLEPVDANIIEIRIDGFSGGHSGQEIHLGKANSNVMLGRVMLNLVQSMDVRIIAVNGGEKDNAIARESEVAIAVLQENLVKAQQIIKDTMNEIKCEYIETDPEINFQINTIESQFVQVFTIPSTIKTIMAMIHMPDGVQNMSHEVEGLVQTSLNMGILRTNESNVTLSYSVRSSSSTQKKYLIEKMRSLAELLGGTIKISGEYPEWAYKKDSKLREIMIETYKELFDNDPAVEGIHAGLECGIFASRIENLDCVSFGPQMKDIHTTSEQLSISSTKRTWDLLVRTLEKLK